MRIGMIHANRRFPPDIRIEKEASVLSGRGHEVLVLCRAEPGESAREVVDGATAVRHRVHPGAPILRRLDSLLFLLTLDSPSWRGAAISLVLECGAQALHVHDLPYVKSAVRAARETGIPVVLDLHENYPAALRLWRRRRIDRLLFSPARAQRLESWAIRNVDRIVVVVDEAKDRVVGLGAEPSRVAVFGNAESVALAAGDAPPPIDANRLHLVYVGGIAQHRGLHVAIAAMPAILSRRPDAKLTIIGAGDTLEALKVQAFRLGVGESIEFTGWLPVGEAMRRVEHATIALVPHERSPHTDATVPHKLFQYMALGRPVVVSDCAPLARIVRETGAGEVFESGNAEELAEAVLALASPGRAEAAGRAGFEAVRSRYNLEADAVVLADLYAGLEHSSSKRR